MSDLLPNSFADLDIQIREVRRELAQREAVYPRFIAAGKLRRRDADARLSAMQAVLATLQALREARGEPS